MRDMVRRDALERTGDCGWHKRARSGSCGSDGASGGWGASGGAGARGAGRGEGEGRELTSGLDVARRLVAVVGCLHPECGRVPLFGALV